MKSLLGMFAKLWEPGQVKTRLAASTGDNPAAEIHRAFVETLATRLAGAADLCRLCYAPASAAEGFANFAQLGWQLTPQFAGDLGRRMRQFFETSLAAAERVVLIGSDSPDLPAVYIAEAFESLRSCPVVLGPAADGGYYLIGASRQVPPVFEGIAWSTSNVWRQTVERLQSAGMKWHELPVWYDVDDDQSLNALLLRLQSEGQTDHALADLRERLTALLNRRPAE
ncbi:MAG TPA: TIGR04282 family arsenosugar biosynthesis glycosyltransferase [Pirellulaceae bacterium]|nr:TIGR04282 family arsenosugar biosynthesis glycosyltransferase [Pirellulaceae bacterium]